MTKELIKRKIQMLREDLAMLTEGSVASDALEIEIEELKQQLNHMNDSNEL